MQAQSLRPYQARTLTSIDEHWEAGIRTIAAVGPTGAGKSRIAREQAAKAKNPIIISHTRGLRDQLQETVGGWEGQSSPGYLLTAIVSCAGRTFQDHAARVETIAEKIRAAQPQRARPGCRLAVRVVRSSHQRSR